MNKFVQNLNDDWESFSHTGYIFTHNSDLFPIPISTYHLALSAALYAIKSAIIYSQEFSLDKVLLSDIFKLYS